MVLDSEDINFLPLLCLRAMYRIKHQALLYISGLQKKHLMVFASENFSFLTT